MARAFRMLIEGKEADVSLEGERLSIGGSSHSILSATLSKKRKYTTFQLVLYLFAVIVAGVIIYATINYFIAPDDEGDPYQDLDESNVVEFRTTSARDPSYVLATNPTGVYVDLQEKMEFNKVLDRELITIESVIGGPAVLHIMWFGSADELMTRGISQIVLEVVSEDEYYLSSLSMVVLDSSDLTIMEESTFTIPPEYATKAFTGKKKMDIEVNEVELGEARLKQSIISSRYLGTYIKITFTNGISQGDLEISAKWAPDYYHETSSFQIISGGIALVMTVAAALYIFIRFGRDEPCLTVATKKDELTLFGDTDDLSKLYYEISKVTIPKMKGDEKRVSGRAGVTKGADLVEEDEAREIGEQLKKYPGGKGRMIVHQCPECMGTELYFESGFMTGYKYHCKKCDYVGSFVIEKEVNFDN